MEINLTSEDVLKIINEKLSLYEPFLAIRYGDGEAILLENKEKNHVESIFQRQLGTTLKQGDIEVIRDNLIKAIDNADLLGIPTIGHIKAGGYWAKSIDILNNTCCISTNLIGSIDFHYEFLQNWANKTSCYDLLLNNIKELYIISCRDISEGFKKRFGIDNVKTIITPPEIMFEHNKYIGKSHYPDRFFEIKDEILSMNNLSGKLLLYGAGFVGKIYGLFWKNQGGVAVDIGSILDRFAGKVTRGKGRSATAFDLTYKL